MPKAPGRTWVAAGLSILAWASSPVLPALAQPAPAGTGGDWPAYNGDHRSARYSALAEITPANVAGLRVRCTASLGERLQFQAGPVVVGGVMVVTTLANTYALDAATCRMAWQQHHDLKQMPRFAPNRGVAWRDGRVFRGFVDGHVAAYDAATGKPVWDTAIIPQGSRAYLSAAPIAWGGLVFIGWAGADDGIAGQMMALRADDGQVAWSFPLVPTGAATGADTWAAGQAMGGGSTWTSYSLDEASGTLYVPTGNPGPDFAPEARPGANLFTGSVVALDARTGALRTWFQLVPRDFHDWDVQNAPALVATRDGRDLAAVSAKDGHLHGVDLRTGQVAWKTAVTTVENVDAPITEAGTRFCPGATGNWNGPAWLPGANLLVVPQVDMCSTVRKGEVALQPAGPYEGNQIYTGASIRFGDPDLDRRLGWLAAVDADTGAVRWRYRSPTPLVAGVLATASGLVFTGDLHGDVLAFDGASGRELARFATGQPVGGGVVTYEAGGEQYVAVAAGMDSDIWATRGEARVVVLGR